MITQDQHDQYHDILYTAWLLQQKLVADLVSSVTEHVQLFHAQTTTSDRYMAIQPSNSPSTCLLSNPVTNKARTLRPPIRQVTFRIVAKDQGYAAWPANESLTGFTASIVRKANNTREPLLQREILRGPMLDIGFVSSSTISWYADSTDASEAGWAQSLRAGDKILVQGYAKRHGWVNFVNDVQVTVFSAVIVR